MTGTQSAVSIWFDNFKKEFALNFIKGAKWKWLVNGLSVTISNRCGGGCNRHCPWCPCGGCTHILRRQQRGIAGL